MTYDLSVLASEELLQHHVPNVMLCRDNASQISPSHLCLAYPPAMYHKIKNSIRFVDINLSLWC
jgi:hypothetical protein